MAHDVFISHSSQDKAAADDPALAGIEVRALPLYMRDLPATTAIARAAVDLAVELAQEPRR